MKTLLLTTLIFGFIVLMYIGIKELKKFLIELVEDWKQKY